MGVCWVTRRVQKIVNGNQSDVDYDLINNYNNYTGVNNHNHYNSYRRFNPKPKTSRNDNWS